MPEAIPVTPDVRIPARALTVRAVRASGPGGQNVNKVSSKVELFVDLARIEGLSEGARQRLDALVAGRRSAEGRLLVTSQRTRDQSKNLEDAREKVRRLVARALVEPVPRRPTRPPAAAHRARRRGKELLAARKRFRARVGGEDE